ncbi:hypothetical protein [Streptomyces sp. NPDC089919]|uniref:hypothetical protein n=1 Tax=Streptomyces sp. NPDC089919 TaxID=3155188 RepID=UPI00341A9B5B
MLDAPVDNTPAALSLLPSAALAPSVARRAFYRLRQETWHLATTGWSRRKTAQR